MHRSHTDYTHDSRYKLPVTHSHRHFITHRRSNQLQPPLTSYEAPVSSAPHPAKHAPFHSALCCVFAHIYYSLFSQIAWLCFISNIKHSPIGRDVLDSDRDTLSRQTSFELAPNDGHRMNICLVRCFGGRWIQIKN